MQHSSCYIRLPIGWLPGRELKKEQSCLGDAQTGGSRAECAERNVVISSIASLEGHRSDTKHGPEVFKLRLK